MADIHYLGEFPTFSAVWKKFPNGGGYGDELMPKGRGRGGASPGYFDRLSDDKVLIAREDNVLMFK